MVKFNSYYLRYMKCIVISLLVLSCVTVCAAEELSSSVLKKVETSKVCMVNNTLFQKDQIPVQIADKTYYGCCKMCEAKLKSNEQARYAIDPVSKAKVDKATSVIGADNEGKVFYFENEENLKKFKVESGA